MRCRILPIAFLALAVATPAMASPLAGGHDEHLSLVIQHAPAQVYVERGNVPITNDRFLSLLDHANVAPHFVTAARQEEQREGLLRILAWVGAVAGGGLALSSADAQPNWFGPILGVGLATMAGFGLDLALWHSPPPFSPDAARDAIAAYNSDVDQTVNFAGPPVH
ncbi:MAG: hypothetical protein KGR26_05760 [Cyanobacteria bacterium REEB65]|nr:hypothetical protein [Cyanobacteria bacterium REEB65]